MVITLASLAGLPGQPKDGSDAKPGTYSAVPSVKTDSIQAVGPDCVFKTWFQTPPLGPDTIRRLHSVQLLAESHDQGFCDDPMAGTWTWFELAIMENAQADKPRVKDGVTLAWSSHQNHLCELEFKWVGNSLCFASAMTNTVELGTLWL